jgi:hypothetical protein
MGRVALFCFSISFKAKNTLPNHCSYLYILPKVNHNRDLRISILKVFSPFNKI